MEWATLQDPRTHVKARLGIGCVIPAKLDSWSHHKDVAQDGLVLAELRYLELETKPSNLRASSSRMSASPPTQADLIIIAASAEYGLVGSPLLLEQVSHEPSWPRVAASRPFAVAASLVVSRRH